MLCFYINRKDEESNPAEPKLEVQWAWFPYFIAADLPMQALFRRAWEEKWKGVLPADLEEHPDQEETLNSWILRWVALQYPGFVGLEEYLRGMLGIQQAA